MSQNNEDGLQRQFPIDFADIEEIVSTAQQRIAELNERIENVQTDRGPVPDYRPQGAPPINRGPNSATIIQDYKRQIGEVQKETTKKVEERTKDIDQKLAKQIKDKTAFLIDENNMFNKLDKEQLAKQKGTEKGGNNLHDYVGAIYFERLDFKVPVEGKKTEPLKAKEQGTIASANNRMAAFLDNSNFAKATEPTNTIDAPAIDEVAKGKNDPDKDIE